MIYLLGIGTFLFIILFIYLLIGNAYKRGKRDVLDKLYRNGEISSHIKGHYNR